MFISISNQEKRIKDFCKWVFFKERPYGNIVPYQSLFPYIRILQESEKKKKPKICINNNSNNVHDYFELMIRLD